MREASGRQGLGSSQRAEGAGPGRPWSGVWIPSESEGSHRRVLPFKRVPPDFDRVENGLGVGAAGEGRPWQEGSDPPPILLGPSRLPSWTVRETLPPSDKAALSSPSLGACSDPRVRICPFPPSRSFHSIVPNNGRSVSC